MADLKSTTIVPISVYCFLIGGYFLYLAGNAVFGNKALSSGGGFGLWLPVILFIFMACYFIIIGIGFLYLIRLCWKMLFFSLAICVSSVATVVIILLVSMMLDSNIIYALLLNSHITAEMWFSFLFVFLSGIIILYYLANEEVVSSFGGMSGPLLSPF